MKRIIEVVSLMFLLLIIWVSGFISGYGYKESQAPDFEQAIYIMEYAHDSHQLFVDNPELIWWAENAD